MTSMNPDASKDEKKLFFYEFEDSIKNIKFLNSRCFDKNITRNKMFQKLTAAFQKTFFLNI